MRRLRPHAQESPAPAVEPDAEIGEVRELGEREDADREARASRRAALARERRARRGFISMPLIALVTVVLIAGPAVIAYLIARAQTPEYAAEAEIVLDSSNVSDRILAQRDIDTQRLVLESRAVLEPTAEAEGMTVDELEEKVNVEVDGTTDLLRLSVVDADRQFALRAADGIVETYRETVTSATTERLDQTERLLRQQMTELTNRLSDVQSELSRLAENPDNAFSPEVQQLQAESNFIFGRLGSLQASLTDLEVRRVSGTNEVRVVTPAHVLEDPVSPQPLRSAAFGGLIGILMAGAALVVLFRLRSRHAEPS